MAYYLLAKGTETMRESVAHPPDMKLETELEQKVRILIIDDHVAMRVGLRSMLEGERDFEVVGTAASGLEALVLLERVQADILLLDLRMPDMDGIAFLREARQRRFAARSIVLTSYETDEDVYRAIDGGAQGYLLKDASEKELRDAILSVHAGRSYLPRHIAARLADRMHRSSLSTREMEVLELMAKGLTNKDIAGALGISSHTVRCHVASITAKLDVSDRTEAVTVAIRHGIIKIT